MDFNGFDKGVIGKGMPIDSTLKRIRETELIERALAELGAGATDNGKRNDCLRHRLWHDAITTKPPRGVDVFVCFSGVDKSGACSSCYINCSGVGRILQCKLTTIEALLGTASNNKALHSEFIASHAPDAPSREEEIAAVGVDEVIEKGMTVFSRNKDGNPILWDYQIKGFFKDACGVLRKVKGTKSSKIKAYKKEIDGLIFVQERQILVQTAEELTSCQRPLRANTPQGEREGLANSEEIAAGAVLEFSILVMSDDLVPAVKEWLSYGKLRGLGQWRNSGKGRFLCEILEERAAEFADVLD